MHPASYHLSNIPANISQSGEEYSLSGFTREVVLDPNFDSNRDSSGNETSVISNIKLLPSIRGLPTIPKLKRKQSQVHHPRHFQQCFTWTTTNLSI